MKVQLADSVLAPGLSAAPQGRPACSFQSTLCEGASPTTSRGNVTGMALNGAEELLRKSWFLKTSTAVVMATG